MIKKMKHMPVKHLADCNICFTDTNGYRTRDKSICKKCEAYNKCIAFQTDRIAEAALHSINKFMRGG